MKKSIFFLLLVCFVAKGVASDDVQSQYLPYEVEHCHCCENLNWDGILKAQEEAEDAKRERLWGGLLGLFNVFSSVASNESVQDIGGILYALLNVVQSSDAELENYDIQGLLHYLQGLDKDALKEFFGKLSSYVKQYLSDDVSKVVSLLEWYFKDRLYHAALEEEATKGLRKKRKIASAVFGALANACVHATQIATAHSEEEKQQGALSLFGTAFGLASQIAAISASEELKNADQEIIDFAVLLVEDVCDIIKDDNNKQYSDVEIDLLLEISRLEDEAARRERILNSLTTQVLGEKILTSSLAFLREFMHEKIDEVVDFVENKLNTFFKGYKILFRNEQFEVVAIEQTKQQTA